MNRPIWIASILLIALTASTASIAIGSDFTLNIFGNANMDDRIDQADIDCIRRSSMAQRRPPCYPMLTWMAMWICPTFSWLRSSRKAEAERISLIDGNQQNLTTKTCGAYIDPQHAPCHCIGRTGRGGESSRNLDNTVGERVDLFPRLEPASRCGHHKRTGYQASSHCSLIWWSPSPMLHRPMRLRTSCRMAVLRFDLSRSSSLRGDGSAGIAWAIPIQRDIWIGMIATSERSRIEQPE